MTAEEVLLSKQHGTNEEWITFTEVEEAMKEYAELKCRKLLEIVAEKAKANVLYDWSGNTGSEYCNEYAVVDKDSILNAVDLKEFCNGSND